MLDNEKFEKREVNGEKIWKKKMEIRRVNVKKGESCGYGDVKNGRERGLENEN